jgi:hypothetical protein
VRCIWSRGRKQIATAEQRADVRAGVSLWCPPLPVPFRALPVGALLLSTLIACNIYDDPGDGVQPGIDGSVQRDRDDDGMASDSGDALVGGAGGNAGGSGVDVNDVGSGGAGGRGGGIGGSGSGSGGSGGTGGTGGQDARVDGAGVRDAPADMSNGGDVERDAPIDRATDDGGGSSDAGDDCYGGCKDGSGGDADSGILDQCPTDPAKTEPGICGCGTPDTDTDADGTADCVDGCPSDPRKTQAGICGCSALDPTDVDAGQAFCLKAWLAHRYSFNGSGTVATDSIAMANGTIHGGSNANMSGGSISLTGDLGSRYTSEGYVGLPSHLLNPFTSVTVEAWITWRGTGSSGSRTWQRIFDFGDQSGSGTDLSGKTYLFLTAHATSSGFPRAAFSANGPANEVFATATQAIALNTQTHVAVVVDDVNDNISLYLNGNLDGSVAWTGALSAINEVNGWLGRSNFAADPEFNGVLHEFRVYRVALTATQVRTSFAAGPDPSFF